MADILNDLSKKLTSAIRNNVLVIDDSILQTPSISSLFQDFIGSQALTINGVKDCVVVSGILKFTPQDSAKGLTTTIYGISVMLSDISFTADSNVLRLKFSSAKIANITIDSLNKSGIFVASDLLRKYLDFSLPNIIFCFDSGSQNVIPSLYIKSGTLEDFAKKINFPILLANQSIIYSLSGDVNTVKSRELYIVAKHDVSSSLAIDVSIQLPLGITCLSFSVNTEQNSIITINDFIKLVGTIFGDSSFDLKNLLPDSLNRIIDNVGLKYFTVQFNDNMKFRLSSFTLGISKPWTILENIIVINNDMNLNLTISNSSSGNKYYGAISGSATLGGKINTTINIPIPINSSAPSTITSNTPISLLGGLSDLASLVDGNNLTSILNNLCNDLGNLTLTDISIAFSFAGTVGINDIQFKIVAEQPWSLPFNSSLTDVNLAFNAQKNNSTNKYEITCSIFGSFMFGTSTEIDVYLYKESNASWNLNIISDQVVLPNISEFADFMGGKNLVDLLPSNSDKLDNLVISDLRLNLDGSKISIFSFIVSTISSDGTPSEWEIIPNALVFKDFTIAFMLSNDATNSTNISGQISGTIDIGNQDVFLSASYDQEEGWVFKGETQNLDLSNLIQKFFSDLGIDFSILPKVMLTDAKLTFDLKNETFSVEATCEIDSTQEQFTLNAEKDAKSGKWEFVSSIDFSISSAPLDLGKMIPVIGDDLKGLVKVNELKLAITSKNPTGITGYDPKMKPGACFSVGLLLDGDSIPLTIPIFNYASTQPAPPTNSAVLVTLAESSQDQTQPTGQVSVQKTLGPLYLQSLKPKYQKQNGDTVIGFEVTASITLGPLSASLDDLILTVDVSNFAVNCSLHGMGVSYNKGGVDISGMFVLNKTNGSEVFDGSLIIKTQKLSIEAIGEYKRDKDHNISFYIFAILAYPIGGPPYLYVNGLAAGLGYNSMLNLPTSTDEINSFPFVEAARSILDSAVTNPLTGGVSQATQCLTTTTPPALVMPSPGEDWISAGVVFSTFGMLNSFALVTLDFGKSIEIGLEGASVLSLPVGESNPLAYVEIDIAVSFLPEVGIFKAMAHINNKSYVFSSDCHLTGDFVMQFWFSPNEHSGDFVIVLGGYHPAYTPPAHYPQNLAPLGLSWQIDSNTYLEAKLYFALTPSAVMAGGDLSVNWHSGDFSAGLHLWADFLVEWKPLHYDISIGVDIYVQADISFLFTSQTISVHVGADIHIWGPSLAGEATIHLWIISFTVSFGSGASTQQGISWYQMIDDYMPAQNSVLLISKVTVVSGLYSSISENSGASLNWVVSADEAEFVTSSAIPSTFSKLSASSLLNSTSPQLFVRPINPDGPPTLTSEHNITIYFEEKVLDVSDFECTPIYSNVPSALWSNVQGSEKLDGNNNIISGVLTGYNIKAKPHVPDSTLPVSKDYLKYEYPTSEEKLIFEYFDIKTISVTLPQGTVSETIQSTSATTTRKDLITQMAKTFNWKATPDIDTSPFLDQALVCLTNKPIIRTLGDNEV